MEEKNNTESKNVTPKDLFVAAIIVVVLLFVGWYETLGEKWAKLVFAAVLILGLIVWLRIPKEKRIEAEEKANKELNKSVIGRAWKYFTWALVALCVVLVVVSFFR